MWPFHFNINNKFPCIQSFSFKALGYCLYFLHVQCFFFALGCTHSLRCLLTYTIQVNNAYTPLFTTMQGRLRTLIQKDTYFYLSKIDFSQE